MSTKKLRLPDEGLTLKKNLESLNEVEALALALFYLEYRIQYYKADEPFRVQKYKAAALLVYEWACLSACYSEYTTSVAAMKGDVVAAARKRDWQSLECVIEQLNPGVSTGNIGYRKRAVLVNTVCDFLEKSCQIPVTEINKLV